MGQKFSMEQDVLHVLGQRSATESDDLGQLVKNFVAAAEPLENTFNGPAKAAFNSFKAKTDEIADTLNSALVGICGSIEGQHNSFVNGATDAADTHRSAEGGANFAGADTSRFAPRA